PLYAGQARQLAVDQDLLLSELARTSPLSVLMAEKLAALRTWAKRRAVPAD
ncbi:ATPase, partial [Pseudomonas aeruginosa]